MTILMKDSGIDWIGEIPANWAVKRVKDIINLRGGGIDKKIIEDEKMVNLVNFIDVFKHKKLDNNLDYMMVSCRKDKIKNVSLMKNDLLITPSSETAKEIGIVNIVLEDLINSVYSYHILRMRLKNKNNSAKYLYYYFNSKFSRFQFENKALGITRVTLSRGDINENIVFIPPLETQKQIADYLDIEVTKLDKQISLLEKKHILLGEYKEALIFETVTKGLDKNARMKGSGIDWIGEIPEEWVIKRLKDILRFPTLNKAKENSKNYLEIGDVNINTNNYNVSDKEKLSVDNAKQAKKGMLVISTVRPARGGITIIKEDCPISSAFCVVDIKGNKYWYYLIKNKLFLNQLSNLNTGVTYPTCKDKDIYNQSSCVPPLETQKQIADYLDIEVTKLDKKRELIKEKVELLKQYKEALIFEVVTGKKEVE